MAHRHIHMYLKARYTGLVLLPVTANGSKCFVEVTTGCKKNRKTFPARPIFIIYIYIYTCIPVTLLLRLRVGRLQVFKKPVPNLYTCYQRNLPKKK